MMRPSWDEYFMALAVVISSRSSCLNVRAGSVVVLDNRIIGTGYNGVPPGVKSNCIEAGCRKESAGEKYGEKFNTGNCIGVHSEINALANTSRGIHKGATIYATVFPCPHCAKYLLAYNIRRVVYLGNYDDAESARSMALFSEAGVAVEKLNLSKEKLNEIIFSADGRKFGIFQKTE